MHYDTHTYCYTILGISLSLAWVLPNRIKPFALAMYLFSALVGILNDRLNFLGLGILSFYFYLMWLRFHFQVTKFKNWLLHFLIITTSLALFFHALPGFNNLKILNGIKISEYSSPYSMYLNFDTGSIAFFFSYLFPKNTQMIQNWKHLATVAFKSFASCAVVLMGSGLSMRYIGWDPKLPLYAPIWLFSNLFFTCVAEECFFRGYLQNGLQGLFSQMKWPSQLAIIITALLFGMRHYYSGPSFIFLSTLAGLFYGYSFLKTKSVIGSVLTHFLVNATHFFLFTYPTLAK